MLFEKGLDAFTIEKKKNRPTSACELRLRNLGFHKSPDVEKAHIKFLKRVIRLNQNATRIALYGECGRFPLNVIRKIRLIKYWFKISTQRNTLMYNFLCDDLSDESYHVNSWFSNIKNLLNDLGFHYLWNNTDVDSGHISALVQREYDQYLQQWNNDFKTSSKLSSYCLYKEEFRMEKYLTCVTNDVHRKALSKLRCSVHSLLIETGCHNNVVRDERKCTLSMVNATEDEYHFVLVCPIYRHLRNELLPKYYCRWTTKQKCVQLIGNSSAVVLNKHAKYIYLAFDLRSSILWFHPFWFAFLNQNCPILLFVCMACLFCIHVLPAEGSETLYVLRRIKELELEVHYPPPPPPLSLSLSL